MIIGFQLSVFALYFGISLIWWISKRIKDYKTSYFRYVLISSLGMITTNLVYTVLTSDTFYVPINIINIVLRINRIFIITTLYVFLFYILSKVLDNNMHRKLIFPFSIIPLCISIIDLINSFGSELKINIANTIIKVDFVYIYTIIVILSIIASIIIFKKHFNKWHRYISIICIVFLSLGVSIHYFYQANGIMETSIILSIAICFLAIENPINKYDYRYACYKPYYIIPCINRYIDNRINGFAVMIGFKAESFAENIQNQLNDLRRYLINQIKTVPECETFITNERDIFVLCDNTKLYKDFIADLKEEIMNYTLRIKNKNIKTTIVYIDNIKNVSKANFLLDCMNKEKEYALKTFATSSERSISLEDVKQQEKEVHLENLLIDTINLDNIEVYYLPKYSTIDNKCKSVEAVLMIKDNNKLLPATDSIIKIAENTGLIMDVCYKVFDRICSFLSNQSSSKYKIETIYYHLYTSQIESPYVVEILIETAKKYNIDPQTIYFEIERNDYKLSNALIIENINKLHEFGFSFSIGDYMVGENDLMDLLNLPISNIKIDKNVVGYYFDTINTKKIVNQIIKLAHNYGISVTADGIDRKNQYEEMLQNGVDYVQGPYFGGTLSEKELISLLKPSIFDIGK